MMTRMLAVLIVLLAIAAGACGSVEDGASTAEASRSTAAGDEASSGASWRT